jgi:hypothetical protein
VSCPRVKPSIYRIKVQSVTSSAILLRFNFLCAYSVYIRMVCLPVTYVMLYIRTWASSTVIHNTKAISPLNISHNRIGPGHFPMNTVLHKCTTYTSYNAAG